MISALALLLVAHQSDQWDVTQTGVWVTEDGKPVVIGNELDGNSGQAIIDDLAMFTEVHDLHPNKGVGAWGSWMSGRNLIADAGSWPGIEDTKAGGLSGRARFLGLGSGKAKLEFYDQNLTLAKSLSLSFVGKSPIINADGRYSDSSITMITQDSEGRSKRTVKGTLTFLGITYNLEGYRYWSRMRFELFNRATGDRAGSGWTSWWPTKECLDKLRGGSIEPTDRMIFGLNPNSGGFPNGVQKVLTLAKPAKA